MKWKRGKEEKDDDASCKRMMGRLWHTRGTCRSLTNKRKKRIKASFVWFLSHPSKNMPIRFPSFSDCGRHLLSHIILQVCFTYRDISGSRTEFALTSSLNPTSIPSILAGSRHWRSVLLGAFFSSASDTDMDGVTIATTSTITKHTART